MTTQSAEIEECPACAVRSAMIRALIESIDSEGVMEQSSTAIVHDSRPRAITFRCQSCKAECSFPHPDKVERKFWPSQSEEFELQPRGWVQKNKSCPACGGRLGIVN